MLRQPMGFRIGGPITPIVKKLMIINVGIFIFQQFAELFFPGGFEKIFGLSHTGLLFEFKIWQPLTYMFLHGGVIHILFNLLALWMFAGEIESVWGDRLFLKYYLFCGTGAGIFIAMMNAVIYSNYNVSPITIGASGAIYGILLAYGIMWPNREVLLYFLFPVKIKYLVIGFGILEFFGTIASIRGDAGNISHIGHLGGLISGFIFIRFRLQAKRSNNRSTNNGSYFSQFIKKRRVKKKQHVIDQRVKAKRLIDSLLDKIAREGMSSLTPEERRLLDWARKHYYPDNSETIH
ncbi:MAG: rhomboid family intramembrane serine protease [Spirochaetota bacterium]|nr:rhomboid family intramembrane serine protease [Spirochaetota bacterium]